MFLIVKREVWDSPWKAHAFLESQSFHRIVSNAKLQTKGSRPSCVWEAHRRSNKEQGQMSRSSRQTWIVAGQGSAMWAVSSTRASHLGRVAKLVMVLRNSLVLALSLILEEEPWKDLHLDRHLWGPNGGSIGVDFALNSNGVVGIAWGKGSPCVRKRSSLELFPHSSFFI